MTESGEWSGRKRSAGRSGGRGDRSTSALGRRLRQVGSAEVLEVVASRLRVIAQPMRVQLMVLLEEHGDATAHELTERMPDGATCRNVSRHLRTLDEAGMLHRTREGHSLRYGLVDRTSLWLVEQVTASVADHIDAQRALLAGRRVRAR